MLHCYTRMFSRFIIIFVVVVFESIWKNFFPFFRFDQNLDSKSIMVIIDNGVVYQWLSIVIFFWKRKVSVNKQTEKFLGKKGLLSLLFRFVIFFWTNKKYFYIHSFINIVIGIFRFSPLVCFVLFDNLYNNKFKKMMIEHQHHPNHYYHHHHPDDKVGNLSIFLFLFLGPYVLFKYASIFCVMRKMCENNFPFFWPTNQKVKTW